MSKLTRWIAALSAVFFAAGGLAACGGIPSDAVVQVNGQAISKSTFEHWLGVAASASAAALPGQKAAKPVVPDPPTYTNCIAHLKEIEPKPAKGQKPRTEAQLKTQCEQQYKALQQQVLGFLISADWVVGQAEEQGVKVSDKEVEAQFNKLKKQQFPKEAEFQKFLATTGQTISDLLLRVKLSMLSTKIQEKVTKDAKKAVNEAAVAKYYNEHKSLYGKPESRDLRLILTKTEAEAAQAKKEIESGKSFASVAKSKSIDPISKDKGGETPGVVKGQEQKALSEAVFAAKTGRAERPREDALRLLRLRSQGGPRAHPAEPRAGQGIGQAAARRHPAAERARQVRQRIQRPVEGPDRMPLWVRGRRTASSTRNRRPPRVALRRPPARRRGRCCGRGGCSRRARPAAAGRSDVRSGRGAG